MTKNIDLCNYDENDKEDKDKWEVDYDGKIGPFFNAITNEKDFDNVRENPVPMGGEGHAEVKYQAGEFVLLSNDKIDDTKKAYLCMLIFFREG